MFGWDPWVVKLKAQESRGNLGLPISRSAGLRHPINVDKVLMGPELSSIGALSERMVLPNAASHVAASS